MKSVPRGGRLYFTLRAILWMFKMVPDHFVLTFLSCSKKVSQAEGMLFEKRHATAMDGAR
jgi:hypothetical protein